MKVLIGSDGNSGAHYYERRSIFRVFSYCGFETKFWDIRAESIFDVFDSGFVPDLMMHHGYNLSDSTVQCIKENPKVKTYLKCGDFGPLSSEKYDLSKYEILVASDKEKEMVRKLAEVSDFPVHVGAHYIEKRADDTHSGFRKFGCIPLHMRMAGDVFEFGNSRELPEFKCDISYLGGFWGYKGKNITKYLHPLLNPVLNYDVKIFGNGGWGGSNYFGMLPDEYVGSLFRSSTININCSEPHANGYGDNIEEYGLESCERIYKVLLSKGFLISDYNKDLAENVFNGEELVWSKDSTQMKNFVSHYLKYQHERSAFVQRGYDKVISSETYFHRVNYLLKNLGFEKEANHMLECYENCKRELSL